MSTDAGTALEDAVKQALIIARGDPDDAEEQRSMKPFATSTAGTKNNGTVYRPFEAAASWLGSDPWRLLKGEKGVTFEELPGIIAELRAQQRAEDVRLGLVAPPSENAFLLFPGVAR